MKNTDNEYKIIVSNKQTIDNKTDTIEETAFGSYYEKHGKQYVLYKTDNNGNKISTVIKLDGNKITIKRKGAVSSDMTYSIGAKRSFTYALPFGTVEMEIETGRIFSNLAENGGVIELVYTLTAQGEKYFNNMKITVAKR